MTTSNLVLVLTVLFGLLNIPLPTAVFSSLCTFIAATTTLLANTNYVADLAVRANPIISPLVGIIPSYDFIIVGAGSCGSVIASRISANENFRVLLLEAGGDPLALNSIPALATFNLHHEETDWMYSSIPQRNNSFASANNSVPLARGKSLGGSSNLNLMIYMRGNPNDFNNWADLTGDSQWNYENTLEFFKKSEDYHGNFPDPNYHGVGGPLTISAQNYEPLIEEWLAAAKELGLNNTDPNAHQTSTFFPLDATIKNGERESTYKAFLEPILNRPNLHIIRYATVTKINLDSLNRATGVTYQRNGQTFTVKASKEVILSAGAFGTPQILMLSGIGPSEHLNSVGIKTKVDLPGVGQNLQDHVLSVVGPFLLNDTVSFILDRNATVGAVTEYTTLKTGPLSYNTASGIGFFSTSDPKDESWPNVCTFQGSFGIHESLGQDYEALFGLKDGTMAKYLEGLAGRDANFALINLGLPASRGTIKLRSSNFLDKPFIDPNYYNQTDDMNSMIKAFKFIIKFYEETNAWKKYNATLIQRSFTGCEEYTLKSDRYIECYLRHFTGTSWHPCCTAKMGKLDDPMTVVDSNLRVRNTQRLRVADASVMARITNGNLNAPTIMIGEKAADLILKRWTA